MIKKVLVFNYTGWNQIAASLTEGLKLNKNIKIFSTTKSCYGADIVINSKRLYKVRSFSSTGPDAGAPSLYTSSTVCDTDEYITECQDLMGECDLIVIYDNNKEISTAHFHNKDGLRIDLHEYALQHHKDKVVMIDVSDFHIMEYGTYAGGHPNYFKTYFKREKNLDDKYPNNVEPLPFSAERRYFASGKDFNKMWDNKDLNLSCLFRYSGHPHGPTGREEIKKAINEKYYDDPKCITKNVFGRSYDDGIDKKIEGKEIGEAVRHHHKYFDVISKSKINIEGLPGNTAFYTGRMMESLANGCCYFYPTSSYNVDFPNGLIDGEDFIIYHSAEDLIEKIEYYLSHETEMKSIAENGFNKLIKYHTSEVRAKEFIETCERYME